MSSMEPQDRIYPQMLSSSHDVFENIVLSHPHHAAHNMLEPSPLAADDSAIQIVRQVDLTTTFNTKRKVEDIRGLFTTTWSKYPEKYSSSSNIALDDNNDKDYDDDYDGPLLDFRQIQELSAAVTNNTSNKRQRLLEESAPSEVSVDSDWIDNLTIVSDAIDESWLLPDEAVLASPSSGASSSSSSSSSTTTAGHSSTRFRPFQNDMWMDKYQELCDFYQAKGHCITTVDDSADLNEWVKRQRYQFKLLKQGKKSTMTQERMELLDRLEFTWDLHDLAWQEKFYQLVQYHQEHGHVNVPINYPSLGIWVKGQRHHYRRYKKGLKSTITPERIERLNALGFCWNLRAK